MSITITITKEGAARMLAELRTKLGGTEHALEFAAAGDFEPLAILVGETPAERARASAPDFREGDCVCVAGIRSETVQRVYYAPIDREWCLDFGDGRTQFAACCTLTHRRHFRAGERCPVVAATQRRQDARGTYIIVRADPGMLVVRYDDSDHDAAWMPYEAKGDPLAADWTALEAVEVKP